MQPRIEHDGIARHSRDAPEKVITLRQDQRVDENVRSELCSDGSVVRLLISTGVALLNVLHKAWQRLRVDAWVETLAFISAASTESRSCDQPVTRIA